MPSWRCNKLRLDGAASSSLQTVVLDLLSRLAQGYIHLHLLLAPVNGEFHSIAGAVGVHHLCQILLCVVSSGIGVFRFICILVIFNNIVSEKLFQSSSIIL